MSMQAEAPVLFERVGDHIAVVTLNRPDARNAVNAEMARELDRIVWEIEADRSLWVAVLAAAGEQAFCAGADLREVAAGRGKALATERGGFAGFVFADRSKPWIAAVGSPAVGGGLELCLACDMIVAADSASFGLPEVKRGVLALAGGLYRLPLALPRAVALEMIATGRSLDAVRAQAFGLVNRVVAPGRLIEEALDLALEICGNSPLAVRESMVLARRAADLPLADLRELGAEAIARLQNTDDFKIGPKAFLERRKPEWTGR